MGIGAVAVYAMLTPSDPSGPATAAPTAATPSTRESSFAGVVARLPFVGTLTWRCDQQQRFFTQLTLPSPGATVHVSLASDGAQVWRHRRVDPVLPPKRTVVGPFQAVRHQTWTVRYRHKPATLTATARLRFAARPSRGQCVVARTNIEVRRTAH